MEGDEVGQAGQRLAGLGVRVAIAFPKEQPFVMRLHRENNLPSFCPGLVRVEFQWATFSEGL